MHYSEMASKLAELAQDWTEDKWAGDGTSERRFAESLLKRAFASSTETSVLTPTVYDYRQILLHACPILDANVWSQLYLNSPVMVMPVYNLQAMRTKLSELKSYFEKLKESPFTAAKPKMRGAFQNPSPAQPDFEWDLALALTSALKVLEANPGHTHYKMYERGQTPALSDSAGLSRINSFLDKYISLPAGDKFSLPVEGVEYRVLGPNEAEVPKFGKFSSKSANWENLSLFLGLRELTQRTYERYQGSVLLIPRYNTLSGVVLQ